MPIVPFSLIGILPMLYITGIANVQSPAGVHLHRRHQGRQHGADDRLRPGAAAARRTDPHEAIRKAAALRVRPVTMTALAAFFAMIPGDLAMAEAASPTPRWPAISSAACWPANPRRCSSCRRSIHFDRPGVRQGRRRAAAPPGHSVGHGNGQEGHPMPEGGWERAETTDRLIRSGQGGERRPSIDHQGLVRGSGTARRRTRSAPGCGRISRTIRRESSSKREERDSGIMQG